MPDNFKILIAYDGSECGTAALDDLKRAGLPEQTEAVILSVADVWEEPEAFNQLASPERSPSPTELDAIHSYVAAAIKESQALAEKGAELVKAGFPSWTVRAESRSGFPAWEIIELSDEWKPDLIVVGSQGRTAIGRAVLGSVSQKVLHEAKCSVRIARERVSEEDSPPRILIAFDGSEFAESAVKAVASREWPAGTEFRIITADDDPGSRPEVGLIDYIPEDRPETAAAKEWIGKVVENPARILRSSGIESSQFIRWGDARRIVLYEANEWKADSIFMGARGLGRFKRFLLGSVSSTVAAKARCSVEIIR